MSGLLTLVSAIVLADTIFFALLSPLLPTYAAALGLSKTAAGALAGAFATGVLIAALPSGVLASRLGVRSTLLLGLGLTAISSLLFGFATRFPVLFVTRLAAGVGSACSWTAAVGWLARESPPARRGELIGFAMSAAVVGAFLGPALGAAAAWIGTGPAFASIAVMCAALGVCVVLRPAPADEPPGATLVQALGYRTLRAPMGLIFLAPLLFAVLGVLAPLMLGAAGWDARWLGALYAFSSGLEAIVHPLLGRWADRLGARAPMRAGLAASTVVLVLLAVTDPPWLVAGLVVAASLTFGATLVPGMALMTRAADAAGLGSVLAIALANLAWALGHAIGAPLCGWLGDRFGDTATYLGFAALCVGVLLALRRADLVVAARDPAVGR